MRDRYAKEWYAFGCVVLDVMIVGTILQATDGSQLWPYALSIAILVGLVCLELQGLRRLWSRTSPV